MKIFVVGGTGNLGLPTVRLLAGQGHEVIATARSEDKASSISGVGAKPVNIDVFDVAALRNVVRGCDAILRLTTKFNLKWSELRKGAFPETLRLRTVGARALIEAALQESVGRYVHESVSFVYADAKDEFIDETFATADGGTEILKQTLAGEREVERFRVSNKALRSVANWAPTVASVREGIPLLAQSLRNSPG